MLFNTLRFALFYLLVYAGYRLLKLKGQNILLLVASYYFYGCWDYRFLSLIVISTLVDYVAGLKIYGTDSSRRKRCYLAISIVMNLGMLGFFKYFNFFIGSANAFLSTLGLSGADWRLEIVLPVGISFYTFQTMSYTIDVYRGKLKPTRDLLNFATFVAFFPQLVAGPIERASHLLPQVEKKREISGTHLRVGAWLIFWGLFKKAVIADNLAEIVNPVFSGQIELSLPVVLVSLYAFAFQIYCDFSGYSDMARGLAACMGFDIMFNFRNPYFAVNPQDFWARWHISLSTWLRDYLYISLGGNRKGKVRTYRNLGLTMILGGLWHGAAWTFVFWGVYQGLLLIVHRLVAGGKRVATVPGLWGKTIRVVAMFHLACLGWLLFRAQSMAQVGSMLKACLIMGTCNVWVLNKLIVIAILCLPLWTVQCLQEKSGNPYVPLHLSLIPRTALYAVILLMLIVLGNTGGQAFIYFQF